MGMREAYQDKIEAQLKEWQARIDVLKAQAEKAAADEKAEYYADVEALRARQQEVRKKLDELRAASEEAWEDVRTGVETAWSDMKHAVERAADKFR
jgi:hypothetical protein